GLACGCARVAAALETAEERLGLVDDGAGGPRRRDDLEIDPRAHRVEAPLDERGPFRASCDDQARENDRHRKSCQTPFSRRTENRSDTAAAKKVSDTIFGDHAQPVTSRAAAPRRRAV